MPLYDFKCQTCRTVFEVKRSMAQADDPISCPQGHADTIRLVPAVSVGGTTGGADAPARAGGGGGGGGCCGGGCCGG